MINKSASSLSGNKLNYKSKSSRINFSYWLQNHKTACKDSLKSLYYAPISNLLTMFILGITLALPLVLYLIVFNINNNLISWQHDFYQFNLYANSSLNEQEITKIKSTLNAWPEIAEVKIISKEAGLTELKTNMGLEEVLNNVDTNPLPTVMIVHLKTAYQNVNDIKRLLQQGEKIAGITKAEADILWLENIVKILKLFTMMIYLFSFALGIAVLLVIGNTLRLMLQDKEKEMAVYSLLGATSSYIRRPFLYGGMFYGLFTGFLGLLVANLLFNKLHHMMNSIGVSAFASSDIVGFSASNIVYLLLTCGLLGLIGARLTLHWQLNNLKDGLAEF